MPDKEVKMRINESSTEVTNLPEEVVIVPIVNSPIYPGMIAPIILSQDKFTPELDDAISRSGFISLNLVKYKEMGSYVGQETDIEPDDIEEEYFDYDDLPDDSMEVTSKDIYKVGVLCKVVKKLKLPDGSVNLLVHGMRRYRVTSFLQEHPLLIARTEVFEDIHEPDEELDAYTRSVINQVKKLSEINPYFNEEMKLAMLNSPSPGSLADLVSFALSLDVPEAQDFLETLVVKKRFAKLLVYLKRERCSGYSEKNY